MRLHPRSRLGFAVRLAVLYAAIFVVVGIQLPFFPVWLKAKGLDAQLIGVVLAMPMLTRAIAIPVAARAADRYDVLRATIILTTVASVAGYVLVGVADGAAAILAAFALASLIFAPIMPLIETYALRGLGAHGQAYGPVRLWGSAAFVAGTFAAGFATDATPARDLIWLIVAASLASALAAVFLAPLPSAPVHVAPSSAAHKSLLRDPAFVAVVVAASLIQASHAVYYGFSALQWRGDGRSGGAIAGLWALGVIAEIVLFAASGRLPPFFSPIVLIIIGAIGGAVRWTAMAFNPPLFLLPWLQLLHALSFGTTYFGSLNFVARAAPHGQSATAQGYLAIASGATMAAAMGASGWLYAAFGGCAYAAMALTAVAGGACALIADQARRRAPL
jgi:MFS transporter, PPP family, 3-phenylpropionic acid transporter